MVSNLARAIINGLILGQVTAWTNVAWDLKSGAAWLVAIILSIVVACIIKYT